MKQNLLELLNTISLARVSALILATALAAGCGKADDRHATESKKLAPVQVRTQRVETKRLAAFEEVVGTVRPKLRATIEAKTIGRIIDMPVVLGQQVQRGDLLARLDAPEIKARAELAEANLQLAEREWKRVSALYDQQAATRADYDSAQSRQLVAKASVAEAQALLGYIEIRAPFGGLVSRKWADIGDLAAPGKPLVDLEDPSRLQVDADIPEALSGSIRAGSKMAVRVGTGPGEILGTVSEVAPVADPVSRTIRLKLDFAAAPGVMSGQFTRLLVPVGEMASMHVPAAAVVQRGQLEIVFAVENQHARLHLVRTGRRTNDETEILSGLDPDDSVVVEKANLLVDCQPLELK